MKKIISTDRLQTVKARVVVMAAVGVFGAVSVFGINLLVSNWQNQAIKLGDLAQNVSNNVSLTTFMQKQFMKENQVHLLPRIEETGQAAKAGLKEILDRSPSHEITTAAKELQTTLDQNNQVFSSTKDNTNKLHETLQTAIATSQRLDGQINKLLNTIEEDINQSYMFNTRKDPSLMPFGEELKLVFYFATAASSNVQSLFITSDAQHYEQVAKDFDNMLQNKVPNIQRLANVLENKEYTNQFSQIVTDVNKFGQMSKEFYSTWKTFDEAYSQLEENRAAAMQSVSTIVMEARNSADRIGSWGRGFTTVAIGIIVALLVGFGFVILRSIMKPLVTAASELNRVTEELTSTANTMSVSSVSLGQATVEQSAAVQETSSSIAQMAAMLTQTSERASQTQQVAGTVVNDIKEGDRVTQALVGSMMAIEQANERLEQISKIISDIQSKTKVIESIVFKTQLLSFNASIEAARAGQHGRGFAVVAEEVGNLATMSGSAAKQIFELVEASKKDVNSIVAGTSETVKDGNTTTQQVRKVFEKISQNMSIIFQHVNDIADAARQQTQGVAQVTNAITQIGSSASHADAAAKEMSDLATNLGSRSEDLQAASGLLHKLAFGDRESTGMSGVDGHAQQDAEEDSKTQSSLDRAA